jgi:predicted amidohydrolase
MRISLVSLDQKWEDKAHNLDRCRELAGRASKLKSELIVFPEMTLTGFTMNTTLSAEDPENSPSVAAFSALAKREALWLIAGVVLGKGGKPGNTLVAFSPDGREQARYVKVHPFSSAGEDRHFKAGDKLATIQIGDLRLGLSICYDLRFPELYSALGASCDVLVNIANWPKARVAHWRTLLRARAIENQVYMIGVNRIGVGGGGLEYEASSVVVNANGDVLDPLISDGELEIYELTRRELLEYRAGFSTRQDRAPQLYRQLL